MRYSTSAKSPLILHDLDSIPLLRMINSSIFVRSYKALFGCPSSCVTVPQEVAKVDVPYLVQASELQLEISSLDFV